MSVNKRRLIRKSLLFLAVMSSVTVELAILLTFLNIYSIIALDLYWTGLIALLAVFVVSIVGMQMVVNIKCERYDNQLNVKPQNQCDTSI